MIEICTAAEAAARDRDAIAAGIPSRALMQRAGAAAAALLSRRYRRELAGGVAVFAGPGRNGGDAWVVARALADAGVEVRVHEPVPARTEDGNAERALAAGRSAGEPHGGERVVVDGMLGSGASGDARGEVGDAIERIDAMRSRGARIVSLDLPSGLDATSGGGERVVTADLTVAFGTLKRGCLVARERCGRIAVVDIGLLPRAAGASTPRLVDAGFVAARVASLEAAAHKGSRRRLAIVGGATGMTGAAVLAAQAAMRSGIGMVRLFVQPDSVPVVQMAAYEALARKWPADDDSIAEGLNDWAHGVLIGPGLGNTRAARGMVELILQKFRGPVVLDADGLNIFEGHAQRLGELLKGRPALITPHVSEFGRLTGREPKAVLDERFDAPADLARTLGAAVLLKGVPTVIASPEGERLVSARGTPVLAAAGSGDLLAGIAATLVTQREEAFESAAVAAWIHGRAGEIAQGGAPARGVPLSHVLDALGRAWRVDRRRPVSPLLGTLPAIADG